MLLSCTHPGTVSILGGHTEEGYMDLWEVFPDERMFGFVLVCRWTGQCMQRTAFWKVLHLFQARWSSELDVISLCSVVK